MGTVAVVAVIAIVLSVILGRRSGRRSLEERLAALAARLGVDMPEDSGEEGVEAVLHHLEQVTGQAAEVVSESSEESIRYRKVLDSLRQGVLICDVSGKVVFRNSLALSLMGGRHGDAIVAQGVVDLLQSAWEKGMEERTVDLYGPPKRSLVIHAQVIDDGRKSLGVIAIIEDVTERRRIDEIRRDFVTNVSHELKTPISALGLLAETLVDEEDTTVAKRLGSRIQKEAFRVSRVIDDLLDLSRIEAEESPQRDPVEIGLIVADAIERVRGAADQRSIEIDATEPDHPAAVLGDRRQLTSAVYNLVENAVKFSDAGNSIEVVTSYSDANATGDAPEVAVSVTDHGIGIPAKDLERIFERFYRVDISRSHQAGGTGLGLSIVRHVASNHGGRVEVDSREGQGSTFKLVLPSLYAVSGYLEHAAPPGSAEPSDTTTGTTPEPSDTTTGTTPEPSDTTTGTIKPPESREYSTHAGLLTATGTTPEPSDTTTGTIPEPSDTTTGTIKPPESREYSTHAGLLTAAGTIPEPSDTTTGTTPEPSGEQPLSPPDRPGLHGQIEQPEPPERLNQPWNYQHQSG
ncbi:MAG: ATP-binding protein [Actinobacteria bacterium]|nr:ATP-binding protein [Actinomycetota bacterium]